MTASITILIVVIVALLAVIAGLGIAMSSRRKKLQQRFGPEYDRLVEQSQSRRMAEAELTERERRVKKLELRELSESARQRYLAQWAGVQEQFVDDPAIAVADGQRLVEAVMRDRGYPAAEFHQTLADLSVEHAQQLDHLRQAHEIGQKAAAGQASTEELRVAMLHYRELFSELLAVPNSLSSGTTESPEMLRERERQIAAQETPNGAPAVPADGMAGLDPIRVPHDDVVIVPDDDDPAFDDEADAEELEAGTGRRGRR
ncbi:MAG TPA: hypothetical protein VFI65_20965 [Streptosporangiaceae bacterium]|nr:hypothetical protein [Streptosporangiaceae bacterium]